MTRRLAVALVIAFAAAAQSTPASPWMKVSYRDLVDRGRMIRTGQSVGEALSLPRPPKGALQPFLDQFSSLLPDVLDMVAGPPANSFRDITDCFAPGAAQPAWVAVLRGGRIVVCSDGADRVRIFLQGSNPKNAYDAAYPLLRHCLAGIMPAAAGAPLHIEVYAYRHDYAQSELSLHTRPHIVELKKIAPPAGRKPLDLDRLEAFFQAGLLLTGAEVDRTHGLVLKGVEGAQPTLDGRAVTLADLAVAYRAVFHAGDNAAFISLDPNEDPARASVNFGGFLENTALGATVLEADKRFKTIGAGLDPNTFTDVRGAIRDGHPGFLTSTERQIAEGASTLGRWVGTRFWFYPESVEIETDPDLRVATIVNARFTADAERQRGDFASPEEFERFKRTRLSPGVRASIDDLNANYDRYAAACPELRELTTVARLMGVCSWLKRGRGRELDLDALLAVELPAFSTPRSREQMMSVHWLMHAPGTQPDTAFIRENLVSEYLTPLLERPIAEIFPGPADLARYLVDGATLDGRTLSIEAARDQAEKIWREKADKPVRDLLKSRRDLQALATRLVERQGPPQQARRSELEAALNANAARIETMRTRLEELSQVAQGSPAARNELRATAVEFNALVDSTNAMAIEFNRMSVNFQHVISIGGGINLGPDEFKISVRPRRGARSAPSGGSAPATGAAPVRRPAAPERTSASIPIQRAAPRTVARIPVPAPTAVIAPRAQAGVATTPATSTERTPSRSWNDRVTTVDGRQRARTFDAASRTLTVVEQPSGAATPDAARRVVGRMENGRVVFRRN